MAFPTSPTDGQAYTLNGKTYVWSDANGVWVVSTATSQIPTFLATSGGTITGALTVTGNVTAGNVGTASIVASGTASITGNANVGNLGTGTIVATGNATIATHTSITGLGIKTRTGAGNFGVRIVPGGGSDANAAILQFTDSAETVQNGTVAMTGSAMSIGTDANTPLALRVNGSNVIVANATTTTVSTSILPGANATYNLGSSTLRWNTVFTTDLELSNGIGDYTVVEGEDDLFLYNNKKGKVYKFVIQEVDPKDAPPKAGAQ